MPWRQSGDDSQHRKITPITPAQKHWFVMLGNFYIQHCAPFSAHSSKSNSGEVLGCTVDIWHCQGISPTTKWSDDLTIFRFPVRSDGLSTRPLTYTYNQEEVLSSVASLGVPWHPLENKGQDFDSTFTYVGFLWSISGCSVRLLEEKQMKYLILTKTFLATHSQISNKCSLKTLLKLQGVFVHISFIYTLGPSYVAPLFHFSCEFDGILTRERYPPPSVIRAVDWWWSRLEDVTAIHILQPCNPTLFLDIHVDALTSWGIGLLWGGKWAAWSALEGWRGPS